MTPKHRRIQSFLLIFLFGLCSLPCLGQEKPAWELYGGYAFERAGVREYYKSTPAIYAFRNQSANLNGWELSATENVNRWLGGTAAFSAHYSTPKLLGIANSESNYSILYGPRFSYRIRHSLTLFSHVLIGASRDRVAVTPVGPNASDLAIAGALGGGVDMDFRGKLAIRIFQADYFRTNTLGSGRNHYRVSAGVVFRLGQRK